MKIYFSEEDKIKELNKIQLEDMLFIGDYIEGQDVTYKIVGKAVIDNEIYHNFVVQATLKEEPGNISIKNILGVEWTSYDYIFN